MKHPNDPISGDLVRTEILYTKKYSIPLFNKWGTKSNEEVARLNSDEIALVLKDQHETGGNGCKIITQNGEIGWVNVKLMAVVK
jgi:hypothetical protein